MTYDDMGCDSDNFFECWVRIIDLNIYVPINVNLEGLAGQRPGIWTRSNFLGQIPNPRAIITGQKRTNFQPLQLRLEVKSVSLKEKTLTFWESRIRFFQQFIVEIKCSSEMPASWRNVFHLHSLTNLQLLNKQIHLLSRLD